MVIVLHGKRFKSALIEVARPGSLVMGMPPLGMSQREPAHEPGEVSISTRPQDEMPMIGHHTIGHRPHRHSLMCRHEHPVKGLIVLDFFKNALPPIRPVPHMIDHAASRGPKWSSHP